MASIYAAMGRRDEALKILAGLNSEVDPLTVANVYFALGDADRGFEQLTKAIEQSSGACALD